MRGQGDLSGGLIPMWVVVLPGHGVALAQLWPMTLLLLLSWGAAGGLAGGRGGGPVSTALLSTPNPKRTLTWEASPWKGLTAAPCFQAELGDSGCLNWAVSLGKTNNDPWMVDRWAQSFCSNMSAGGWPAAGGCPRNAPVPASTGIPWRLCLQCGSLGTGIPGAEKPNVSAPLSKVFVKFPWWPGWRKGRLRCSGSRSVENSPWPTELGHRRFLVGPWDRAYLLSLPLSLDSVWTRRREMCLLFTDSVHLRASPKAPKFRVLQTAPGGREGGLSPSAPAFAPAFAPAQPHPGLLRRGRGVEGGKGAWETSLISECCP